MNQPELLKGPALEEALRHYFLGMGYYVIRGSKFRYQGFDITDVDLWLYAKPSALARQRSIVDIKNKKTPQALERVFWAIGLTRTLGVDECVVATTDTRPAVREFGLQNSVRVLDGAFLKRLQSSPRAHGARISEEDFLKEADTASLGKLGGDWKGRYETAKSRMLTDLTIDTGNSLLSDIGSFLEHWSSSQTSKTSLRLAYALSAMFLISVDFVLKDYPSLDADGRFRILDEGFRFGRSGSAYASRVAALVGSLTEAAGLTIGARKTIVAELERQAAAVPAQLLAEHFSKSAVQAVLMPIAIILEAAAFSPEPIVPSALPPTVQATLGVLVDFVGLDRKKVLV